MIILIQSHNYTPGPLVDLERAKEAVTSSLLTMSYSGVDAITVNHVFRSFSVLNNIPVLYNFWGQRSHVYRPLIERPAIINI